MATHNSNYLQSLSQADRDYINRIAIYIEKLRMMPDDEAKEESTRALIRTGVLDPNGNPKKNIVSWA